MSSSTKYPYLSNRREFSKTPLPTLSKFQLSFIHFFKLERNPTPHPLGNSNPFCEGIMDIFWNCKNIFKSFKNFKLILLPPTCTDHKSTVTCCRFAPMQNRICTTSMDRTTKITDMLTFTEDYNVTLTLG